jgi:hypothetical protein
MKKLCDNNQSMQLLCSVAMPWITSPQPRGASPNGSKIWPLPNTDH